MRRWVWLAFFTSWTRTKCYSVTCRLGVVEPCGLQSSFRVAGEALFGVLVETGYFVDSAKAGSVETFSHGLTQSSYVCILSRRLCSPSVSTERSVSSNVPTSPEASSHWAEKKPVELTHARRQRNKSEGKQIQWITWQVVITIFRLSPSKHLSRLQQPKEFFLTLLGKVWKSGFSCANRISL